MIKATLKLKDIDTGKPAGEIDVTNLEDWEVDGIIFLQSKLHNREACLFCEEIIIDPEEIENLQCEEKWNWGMVACVITVIFTVICLIFIWGGK